MDRYKVLSIKDFVDFCSESLQIAERPQIYFTEDRSWALQRRSFGEYNPGELSVTVYVGNRNTADIIRTLAHEMVHHKQNEMGMIRPGSGQTGTKIEDQANALAGILLREYGKMNELIYERRKSHTPKDILIEAIKVKLYPGDKGVDTSFSKKDIDQAPKVQIPLSKLYRNEPASKMKTDKAKKNIDKLVSIYKDGKKIDPILVQKVGNRYKILDGHHRYTAAKRAGLESINAIVVPEKNITLLERVDVPIIDDIENEIFSAYNGRYIFDVTKAYDYIKSGKVKSAVKKFDHHYLHSFAHPDFSYTDPKKVEKMKVDYEKPLGILVKFEDPESKKSDWVLIDGNHRVRKAANEKKHASVYVVSDPQEVKKFMKVNKSKPHELFPDYED